MNGNGEDARIAIWNEVWETARMSDDNPKEPIDEEVVKIRWSKLSHRTSSHQAAADLWHQKEQE